MTLSLVMLANSPTFFCFFASLLSWAPIHTWINLPLVLGECQYGHMFDHHIFGTHQKNIAFGKQCLIKAFSLLKQSLCSLNKGKCKNQPLLIEIRIILLLTKKMKALRHKSLEWNKMLCKLFMTLHWQTTKYTHFTIQKIMKLVNTCINKMNRQSMIENSEK